MRLLLADLSLETASLFRHISASEAGPSPEQPRSVPSGAHQEKTPVSEHPVSCPLPASRCLVPGPWRQAHGELGEV